MSTLNGTSAAVAAAAEAVLRASRGGDEVDLADVRRALVPALRIADPVLLAAAARDLALAGVSDAGIFAEIEAVLDGVEWEAAPSPSTRAHCALARAARRLFPPRQWSATRRRRLLAPAVRR